MQTKLRVVAPEASLTRILASFEQELLDALDEEIMEAAKDLGMNPQMKGSAAFFGVTRPVGVSSADIHSFAAWTREYLEAKKLGAEAAKQPQAAMPEAEPPKPKKLIRRRPGKDPHLK